MFVTFYLDNKYFDAKSFINIKQNSSMNDKIYLSSYC